MQTIEKFSLNNISVCAYYHHGHTVTFSVANLIFQEQVADTIPNDHLGQCYPKFWQLWTNIWAASAHEDSSVIVRFPLPVKGM